MNIVGKWLRIQRLALSGFALIGLSACNPFGGDLETSVADAGFHPGYISRSIRLDSMATLLRGSQAVHLTYELPSEINSAKLEITTDGVTYSLVSNLSFYSSSYDWTVPLVNTVLAQLKLTVVNRQGIESSQISSVFSIDSIAPTTPSVTLVGASTTNSSSASFTIASCTDRPQVIISESSSPPSLTASGWQNCSTSAGAITHTLSAGEGARTLYAFARDDAGNVSLSQSLSLTLDSVAPALSFTAVPVSVSTLKGGSSFSLTWTASDATTGIASLKLYYASNGTTYDAGTTLATTATSLSWTVPFDNVSGAKIKLVAIDGVGNTQSIESTAFMIDSTVPTLSLTSPSGSYRGGSSLSVVLSASDALSGLSVLKLQYAADGTTFADLATLSNTATSYAWTIPSANVTTAKLKLVATDNAGNSVSSTSSAFTIDSAGPTAPSVTIASANPTTSTSATLTVASCTDRTKIYVSETSTAPAYDASGWQTCSTTAGAITDTLSSGDGTKTLYVFAQDAIGNLSTATTLTDVVDTTAPTISLTALTGGQFVSGLLAQSITWTAADTSGSGLKTNSAKIEVSSDSGTSWTSVASSQTTAGPYAWTAGTGYDGTHYRVRVTVSDNAGNTKTATSTSDFTMDSVKPTITASQMSVNGSTSNPSITNNNVTVSFQASDTQTKITHFCLTYNTTTTPDINDSCWHAVNEPGIDLPVSTSLSLSNYPMQLGFATGTYKIAAWVHDQANNINALTNSGSGTNGQDVVSATYIKPDAIVLTGILSVSSTSPNTPLISSDTNMASGSPLYIKWKSSVPSGNSIQSLKIEYLTNEQTANWTDVGATTLVDGSNGCTPDGAGNADDGYTGCYLWSAPASTYFKIRVSVTDQYGALRSITSTPNNTTPFEILAGNLDTSLNGDPRGVVLGYAIADQMGTIGSIAVTPLGLIYFLDTARGILKYDPNSNGIVQIFKNGAASAAVFNNTARSSVTFKNVAYIDNDSSGNLYIFDQNYIHKWDPVTDKVTTIIGGGLSTATTVTGGLNLNIPVAQNRSLTGGMNRYFTVFQNGDILFRSDGINSTFTSAFSIRYYKASEDKVYSINLDTSTGPSSAGTSFNPAPCFMSNFAYAFDPTTSAVTHVEYRAWNDTSGSQPSCILGGFQQGTVNLSVPASLTDDAGVTLTNAGTAVAQQPPTIGLQAHVFRTFTGKDGKIYLEDFNSSRLFRYTVATNAYAPVFGSGTKGICIDGADATACPSKLSDAYITREGRIYVVDRGMVRMVDESGKVRTIFGQSTIDLGSSALSARFASVTKIKLSPTTRELVFADASNNLLKRFTFGGAMTNVGNGTSNIAISASERGDTFDFYPGTADLIRTTLGSSTGITRQDTTTGVWSALFGTGAVSYVTGDGQTGANVSLSASFYTSHSIMGIKNGHILVDLMRLNGSTAYDHFIKAYDIGDSFRQSHVLGVAGIFSSTTCSGEGADPSTCAYAYNGAPNSPVDYDGTSSYVIFDSGSNKILKLGATRTTWVTLAQTPRSVAIDYAGNRVYYCANDGLNYRIYSLNTSTSTLTKVTGWPLDYDCVGTSLVIDDGGGARRLIFGVALKGSSAVQGVGALGNLP